MNKPHIKTHANDRGSYAATSTLTTDIFHYCFWLSLFVLITACSQPSSSTPAPLGDINVLEELADAYRQQSEALPASPTALTPAGRRKFLDEVFAKAGYSYSNTLISLSAIKKSSINKNHRDLKQLLYLPLFDKRVDSLSDIYSEEEIAAINRIDLLFK